MWVWQTGGREGEERMWVWYRHMSRRVIPLVVRVGVL